MQTALHVLNTLLQMSFMPSKLLLYTFTANEVVTQKCEKSKAFQNDNIKNKLKLIIRT